ncbi:TfoX/Sxy family protein [Proteocatella sphenisci]|uniref:TfoX/Sxy family protein n=1 Tax=Proteocatella sphenisci TaxID=181070 RepID=UPI002E8E521A|nr:TfoX/Sxy family protein [Proteocatella sphenisci]
MGSSLEQFEQIDGVTSRPMMGGYIFYYKKKIFGGIYEPGFMVKITDASRKYLPKAESMPPYKGAKDLVLVDDIDNKELLCSMVQEMYDELPAMKSKKKK